MGEQDRHLLEDPTPYFCWFSLCVVVNGVRGLDLGGQWS